MRTGLYEKHLALGAKMVDFSGWEMPIQYQGIVHEHMVVREKVGVFDVSHMGRLFVRGQDAEALLDFLSTNKVAGKANGSATYTVWSSEEGRSVDDVIIYRRGSEDFFVVVNAGNRQKDLEHLLSYAKDYRVEVTTRYDEDGILAIQGPHSAKVLESLFPEISSLKFMHFADVELEGKPVVVSCTGYTGSLGYEIYAGHQVLVNLWDQLMILGKEWGIEPVGLGARDTLRMEMGFALYGNELGDQIAATESVSSWTVKLKKLDFLGKEALLQLEKNPRKRSQHGIVLLDKGVPRSGYEVFKGEKPVGKVTSGTFSPCLHQGIAIVSAQERLALDEEVFVHIRNHMVPARVVALPFVNLR